MVYTNLYLVFRKMKQEKFVGLPGMNLMDYSNDASNIDEIKLNAKINRNLQILANMPLVKKEIIQDIYDNSFMVINNADAKYMKLLYYGEYKFLFFEYGEYTILINYGKGKLCYTGDVNTWEYLPNKEENVFYRHIEGTRYFMVNAFEAYCKYVQLYLKVYPLTKEYNTYFYDDAINALHSHIEYSTEYNSLEDYFSVAGKPALMKFSIQEKSGEVSFTFFVQDYLIIMVDFNYFPLARSKG